MCSIIRNYRGNYYIYIVTIFNYHLLHFVLKLFIYNINIL